jgi:hypothetical protein
MCVCPIVILTWGRVNSKYLQDFSDFVHTYRPHGILSKFRSVYLLLSAWNFRLLTGWKKFVFTFSVQFGIVGRTDRWPSWGKARLPPPKVTLILAWMFTDMHACKNACIQASLYKCLRTWTIAWIPKYACAFSSVCVRMHVSSVFVLLHAVITCLSLFIWMHALP